MMNASLSQYLKLVIRSGDKWKELSDMQRESLDIIVMKISRILSGDQDDINHWNDIAIHANLVKQGLVK